MFYAPCENVLWEFQEVYLANPYQHMKCLILKQTRSLKVSTDCLYRPTSVIIRMIIFDLFLQSSDIGLYFPCCFIQFSILSDLMVYLFHFMFNHSFSTKLKRNCVLRVMCGCVFISSIFLITQNDVACSLAPFWNNHSRGMYSQYMFQ